jgi:hypothetical protein
LTTEDHCVVGCMNIPFLYPCARLCAMRHSQLRSWTRSWRSAVSSVASAAVVVLHSIQPFCSCHLPLPRSVLPLLALPTTLHYFLPDILWLQLSASLVLVQAIWSFSIVLSSCSSSRRKATKWTREVKRVACCGRVGVSEEKEREQETTSHG